LLAACADPRARVTALYAVTPGQWRRHDVAGVRIDFERRQLACLRDELAALNIPLCLLEADDYAALVPVLARWADAHGVTTLHAN
ncbi:deoxyribodipyrimidine photo-lyase, partial [Acinetobacter baumannii]